jgi:hypothetical protein
VRKSKKLEARQRRDAALAEAELQSNAKQTETFVLPSEQETDNDTADVHTIHQRIQGIIRTLNDFRRLGDHDR